MNKMDLYTKFDKLYSEDDFYERLDIIINLEIPEINESNDIFYKIPSIDCKTNYKDNEQFKRFIRNVQKINEKLYNYSFNGKEEWQLFYLYKELIQIFEEIFEDNIKKIILEDKLIIGQ